MKLSMKLPFLQLESVTAVSKLNGWIAKFSFTKEVVTQEVLDEIFESYDGNIDKYLEVYTVLLKNIVDNRKVELYQRLSQDIEQISMDLQPEEGSQVDARISKMLNYLDTKARLPDIESLKTNLRELVAKIRSQRLLILPQEDDHETTEMVFNTLSNSDIQFSATLDAVLEMCQELLDAGLIEESMATKMRRAKDKVVNTITKFSLKDKEMSEKLNEKFNRFLGDYKENRKVATYDKLVKDTFNLSRMLKSLIGSGIVALLVPGGVQAKLVSAIIFLLIRFAKDRRTEDKHKKVIVADLKFEKTVLEEKIRDADTKGDTKSKYKLMRINNEVSRAIDRITYGLAQN